MTSMSSSASSVASTSQIVDGILKAIANDFGVWGDFAGDENLLCLIQECQGLYQMGGESLPSLDPLIHLLHVLPFQARQAVANKIIAPSPFVDQILVKLYDYCFEEDASVENESDEGLTVDQDFVWLSVPNYTSFDDTLLTPPTLNVNRHNIFSIIPGLLRRCPSCYYLGEQYLQSASTRFQTQIILSLLYIEGFHNDKVVQTYAGAANGLLCKKILAICSTIDGRRPVLERLIDQKLIEWKEYIFFCTPPFVARYMDDLIRDKVPLDRWDKHGEIYLSALKERLEKCGDDVLQCGHVWNAVTTLFRRLEPCHLVSLMNFLDQFHPCQLDRSVPPNIRRHLETLSSQRKPELKNFEYVEPIFIGRQFLLMFPKKVRKAMLLNAIQEQNFSLFVELRSTIDLVEILPLKAAFDQATPEQLWKLMLGKKTEDPFLDYYFHSGVQIVLGSNRVSCWVNALHAWKRWHLRSTPPAGILEGLYNKSHAELWKIWLESSLGLWDGYCLGLDDHVDRVCSRIKVAANRDRPLDYSQLTMYARYARELINMQDPCLEIAAQNHLLSAEELIHHYGMIVRHLFCKLSIQNPPLVLHDLLRTMDDVAESKILPRLSLSFDPTESTSYVTRQRMSLFHAWMSQLVRSSNTKIVEACMAVLESTITKACRDNKHTDLPNGMKHFAQKTKSTGEVCFVYYDSSLHREAINVSVTMLRVLMEHSLLIQSRAWPIVKKHAFQNVSEHDQYISFCCTVLSPDLRLKEEDVLVARLQQSLKLLFVESRLVVSTRFRPIARDVDAGTLEKVFAVFPQEDREWLEQEFGDFRKENTRALIQVKTTGRDGNERAAGHVTWLCRAVETLSPDIIASSISFSVSRVKNEAGLYRSLVYGSLRSELITRIVQCTLEQTADAKAAASIAASLNTMLCDDLNHRDSVGHRYFSDLAEEITFTVLTSNPTNLLIEVRNIWIECAVKLGWQLAKAGGNENLISFSFPIRAGFELPTSSWIEAKAFDTLYPHRECPQTLVFLRDSFSVLHNVKDIDHLSESVVGTRLVVEMFENALGVVWESHLPDVACRLNSEYFPQDKLVADGILGRLQSLFLLCGITWEESPTLSSLFDRIFGPKMEVSPIHHFHCAVNLLETIFSINTGGSPLSTRNSHFFAMDRLATACDAVFRYAVKYSIIDQVYNWYPHWYDMHLYRGARDWMIPLSISSTRVLPFIVRHVPRNGQRFPPRSTNKYTSEDLLQRQCVVLRLMIHMTKSSVYYRSLRDLAMTCRPDILASLLCGPNGSLKGVFRQNDKRSQDDLFYDSVSPSDLVIFPSHMSPVYKRIALERSKDTTRSIWERTRAIQLFVQCPSTHHSDVLRALYDDGMEMPILEALVLSIFSLDSPWHVLAHLLSVDVLERRPQHTTASLLSRVGKHIHVDQVVHALGLLLQPTRRQALKVSLHKSIIRMLFDARTDHSLELLRTEWNADALHDDVRYVMTKSCLEATIKNESNVDWEWSVLQGLASKKDLDVDTALTLLSVFTDRYTISMMYEIPGGAASEDVGLVSLRTESAQWSNQDPVRLRRFSDWLKLLQGNLPQTGLQRVATVEMLKLASYHLANIPATDHNHDAFFQEMERHLSSSLGGQWSQQQGTFVARISNIYATSVCMCVRRSILERPESTQNIVTDTTCKDECSKLSVAQNARGFVSRLVRELIMTEKEILVRKRLILTALNGMLDRGTKTFPYLLDPEMIASLEDLRSDSDLASTVAVRCLQCLRHRKEEVF